jgi:hypothetical protein
LASWREIPRGFEADSDADRDLFLLPGPQPERILGGVQSDEPRPPDPNSLHDPYAGGRVAPPRRWPSTAEVVGGAVLALPFILVGLYLSAMMLVGVGLMATGVSAGGGVVLLLVPVPAIVGIALGVAAYRWVTGGR